MDSLDLITYTKINSKWVKDLNVRPETIKLLEENIGRTLYDINHSKILYDPPPRVRKIKTKKINFQIKFYHLCYCDTCIVFYYYLFGHVKFKVLSVALLNVYEAKLCLRNMS